MDFDPNDVRLTAYALGELDEKERAEVEALLRHSDAARRAVDEVRATAELLTKELESEPAFGLADEQRTVIEAKAAQTNCRPAKPAEGTVRFSRQYRVPLALAASVLVLVGAGTILLPSLSASREVAKRYICPSNATGSATPSTVDFRHAHVMSYGYEVPFGQSAASLWTPTDEVVSLIEELGSGGDTRPEQRPGFNTEAYDHIVDNPFLLVTRAPLSTFSIDVDTASYANIRRFLNQGTMPPKGAVRIEEMVNYFDYDYPLPTDGDPFSVNVDVADCPWNEDHLLARIGLKGWEIADEDRPPANLVFLIDVSGSMQPPNKLPLLKRAMKMLVGELRDVDRVAMVVYAGASGLVLESTSCEQKDVILGALDRLRAGGSTNGGAGIQLAYDVAQDYFDPDGINRVILATDGDFNVGITNRSELTSLIEENAQSGVFLTVLGFGMGNFKDATLETLADKGNGNYAYIDTLREAQKVLVEEMGSTLITIAKDVKIQIEFNPTQVNAYRLIGYENRLLAAQDFNDDTKDAGEIGAGHTVTAFYEIVPAGVDIEVPDVDPLKYQTPTEVSDAAESGELMTVKLRYKEPDGDTSKLIEAPVFDEGLALEDMSEDFVFAASVASFGMFLRDSPYKGDFTLDAILGFAESSRGDDEYGYRAEFVDLVQRAREIEPAAP